MIVCSVLPLLAFQAYTVTRSAFDQKRLAEIRAERATHDLGDLMDRELAELEAGLAVLGDAPPLVHGNLDLFSRSVYDFARHNGVDVELADAGGQLLFNTAVAPGRALQRTGHPHEIDAALRTGRPQILDAFEGPGGTRRAGMAYPVRVEGRHTYVLVASWPLPGIAAALAEARLPAGWAAAVLDRNGVRLWRHADVEHPELVGKPVAPSFLHKLNEQPNGHHENTLATDDKTSVLNFTSRLRNAPWMTVVAVPKAELTEPFTQAIALMSGAGVAALLLGLGVAGWLTRKAQREALTAASLARDGTRAGAVSLLSIRELRELADAIVDADRARIDAEHALRASEERWKFALEGAGDGVWDWNVQTGELVLSPRWLSMLGYAPYEVGTRIESWREHVHPDDMPAVRTVIRRYLKNEILSHRLEYRMRHKHGGWVWFVSRGMLATRTPEGAPLRLIGTNTDITERKRMEAELQQLATTDFLTGLANRRCFIARLEEEHGRLRRMRNAQACVLMLDLDHFKQINDTHGHAAGDAVLCQFADLLQETPRKSDFVSRLGGEEFAVLLSGASLEEALAAAHRLCAQVAHTPMYFDGGHFPVTVSIGVAAMRAGDSGAAMVLSRADAALYRAKHGGRNRVETLDAA